MRTRTLSDVVMSKGHDDDDEEEGEENYNRPW